MAGFRPSGEASPIDRAALAGIAQGDAAAERRLFEIFVRAYVADAAALRDAVTRRDAVAVKRAAHRITGAGRLAGANRLATVCGCIAQAGAAGDWDGIDDQLDALYREFDRVDAYLRDRSGQ